MPVRVAYPKPESAPNVSVPVGHRSKCRKCGAVDSIKLVGMRRLKRCNICGSTLAQRSVPRKPKVISFEVIYLLNGEKFGRSTHVTQESAEFACHNFAERGPVARSRVAQLVELLDGEKTGNVRVLRYDNYKGKRQVIVWQGGCVSCKGSGVVSVRIPIQGELRSSVKFVACVACNGLGGDLTREVNYRRFVA